MNLRPAPLLLYIMYVTIRVAHGYSEDGKKIENALRILQHMTETRKGLNALRDVIDGIDIDLKTTQQVKDLTTKRKGLEVLRRILQEMDADLVFEQKRTCAFNLGGHCATESAANVADQWHFLNSPLSPGRKRRHAGLLKKLVSKEIVQ